MENHGLDKVIMQEKGKKNVFVWVRVTCTTTLFHLSFRNNYFRLVYKWSDTWPCGFFFL